MSPKNGSETTTHDDRVQRKRSSTRYWRTIKGNLYARLQYTDDNGRPKEKLRRINEKKEAVDVLAEMRRELGQSGEEALRSDRMTFARLAELFTEGRLTPPVYANGVKVSGLKSRLGSTVGMLSAHFGSTLIRSIRPRELERFKTKRLATPVVIKNGKGEVVLTFTRSIATVNRELAILRSIFSFALQNDWIQQNPFTRSKGVIVMAAEKERSRVLSYDEEVRLLAQCVGDRAHLRPIVICALDTAMRSGEMFKMRWSDIDFINGEISIPQTNTKTERSRIVGITPRLRAGLERLCGIFLQKKHSSGCSASAIPSSGPGKLRVGKRG